MFRKLRQLYHVSPAKATARLCRVNREAPVLASQRVNAVGITWIGHSSFLLQLGG